MVGFFLKLGICSVPDRRELATRAEQPLTATPQHQDGARAGSGQSLHGHPGTGQTPLLWLRSSRASKTFSLPQSRFATALPQVCRAPWQQELANLSQNKSSVGLGEAEKGPKLINVKLEETHTRAVTLMEISCLILPLKVYGV